MRLVNWSCRVCKKETTHRTRYVSDLLPPNVHVLECTGCSYMGITLVEIADEGVDA